MPILPMEIEGLPNISGAEQAWIVGALGTLYSGYTLWHARGVRAARAIAKGLSEGAASISIKS